MFTTDPFSIRTYRGMGELDPPGTNRDRGVEGGARTAREGAVGTESRLVRAEKAGSSPPPTSLSAVALALQSFALQREEKGRQISRSGKHAILRDGG